MAAPATSGLQVIFMDAGQGDCTLIVYPDNSLTLVDCGSTKNGDQAFGQIWEVLSRYLPLNKNKLNNLVLTHPDEDHYNKLSYLLTRKDPPTIEQIYYGGTLKAYRNKRESNLTFDYLSSHKECSLPANTHSAEPDKNLSRAGVKVTILAANSTGNPRNNATLLTANSTGDRHMTAVVKNTNSIVLMVEFGPAKLFLMGDAFVETEAEIMRVLDKADKLGILQKGAGVEETVLKMGHHGSDTSTGPEWVKAVGPGILVVSSATKTFRTKGMPTKTKMENTVLAAGSTLNKDTGIAMPYVVYVGGGKDTAFVAAPATTQGIWTTCFGVTWVPASGSDKARWYEAGQTWYYGVTQDKKLPPCRWYAYTGFEEEEEEEKDDDEAMGND
ncbi:MAG TPA: MBL fold metallo-hydrolase [Longimicrobium sp.]|jgi:beta-lactamase superfamily II metal-dependent hydrolase